MTKPKYHIILLALASLSRPVLAVAPDGCQSVSNVQMIFLEPLLIRSGEPYGKFKLINRSAEVVVLSGEKTKEGFGISYPQAQLQAESGGRVWKGAYVLTGSWAFPHKLTIAPGASAEVFVSLDRFAEFERPSLRFRVVINLAISSSSRACIVSGTFAASGSRSGHAHSGSMSKVNGVGLD